MLLLRSLVFFILLDEGPSSPYVNVGEKYRHLTRSRLLLHREISEVGT